MTSNYYCEDFQVDVTRHPTGTLLVHRQPLMTVTMAIPCEVHKQPLMTVTMAALCCGYLFVWGFSCVALYWSACLFYTGTLTV